MVKPRSKNGTDQTASLQEYRRWLVEAEQKSQEDFDKAVLSLSGGALGISFVFLKDVVGSQPLVHPVFLLGAWMAWGLSTLSVLVSYYLSHLALRRAISQVDDGTIYEKNPGGSFAAWTALLNASGAVLFVVGVCCITYFAGMNLPTKGEKNVREEVSTSSPEANPSAASAGADPRQRASNHGRLPSTTSTPTEKEVSP